MQPRREQNCSGNEVIEALWREAWTPPDRRPVSQWAEDNIVFGNSSPFPGNFSLDNSPWIEQVLEVFSDHLVREIDIVASVQSVKTLIGQICLAWVIANDPGPTSWYAQSDEDAREFADMRLWQMLHECPVLDKKFPTQRGAKRKDAILFPEMPLLIQGANPNNVQSKSFRYLFCDETWLWKAGMLAQARNRVTAFKWNSRIFLMSTGSIHEDETHKAFLAGDQREWHVPCPQCYGWIPMYWRDKQGNYTLRWENSPRTRDENGVWNFAALRPTVHVLCPYCAFKIPNEVGLRRDLNRKGKFIALNPQASRERVSFHWSCLTPHWIDWADMAEEWLKANAATHTGSIVLLKEFLMRRAAEFWEERVTPERDELPMSGYKKGETWEEAAIRFLTADVQADHFWAVVRDWTADGRSRLVWEGRLNTYEQIRDLQIEMGIPDVGPQRWLYSRVAIDTGYDQTSVFMQCLKYFWIGLKGDKAEQFSHYIGGKRRSKLYSEWKWGDPGMGTGAQGQKASPYRLWSTQKIQDVLGRLRNGEGPKWELPYDISDDYAVQIKSHSKRAVHHPRTGAEHWEWQRIGRTPDHLYDCESMQVVLAIMVGLIRGESGDSNEKTDTDQKKLNLIQSS